MINSRINELLGPERLVVELDVLHTLEGQELTERADAVVSYLTQAQVARSRIVSEGLGEDGAVGSNATAEGRAKNRRVEIHITPNEELKKADAENAAAHRS